MRGRGVGFAGVVAGLLLGLLPGLGLGAVPAAAQDGETQADYLAQRLREDPVYVSDQVPLAVPRSAAGEFAKVAERTGVPTYVLVLPNEPLFVDQLLAAVRDRLGEDGLYVVIDAGMSWIDAAAYGVDVPVRDARSVTTYELPHDAWPIESFRLFVEALTDDDVAARAQAAREKYGSGPDGQSPTATPPPLHGAREEPQTDDTDEVSVTDRKNQSFLTGISLAGLPLLILLLTAYARRLRRLPYAAGRGRH
ncbi:hypothetical protein O7599_17330 [Streptomyces sp. WMMC500]|uniref:hypothetical protein n=1 Tax=Streptomyces sp. WMMC500 TaxID=3015154 RepID=UPI00248D3829|nr:hypothetical protein [Streptomyces sp. WMMC500]WBB64165.1 hypothetical protein O7599_17330 [Streptomyces sp. WMMC500]